jgi:hypothetical protein
VLSPFSSLQAYKNVDVVSCHFSNAAFQFSRETPNKNESGIIIAHPLYFSWDGTDISIERGKEEQTRSDIHYAIITRWGY